MTTSEDFSTTLEPRSRQLPLLPNESFEPLRHLAAFFSWWPSPSLLGILAAAVLSNTEARVVVKTELSQDSDGLLTDASDCEADVEAVVAGREVRQAGQPHSEPVLLGCCRSGLPDFASDTAAECFTAAFPAASQAWNMTVFRYHFAFVEGLSSSLLLLPCSAPTQCT